MGFLAVIRCVDLGSCLSPPPWGPSPGCPVTAMGRGGLGRWDKTQRPVPSSVPGPISPQLPTFIAKVLDTICFIWATSEYYNTPVRIIVILQEFCNQIIEMVTLPWPPGSPPSPPGWGPSPVHCFPAARVPQQFESRPRCRHKPFQAPSRDGALLEAA